MRRRSTLITLVVGSSLFLGTGAARQSPTPRATIAAAITALGGEGAVARLTSIRIESEGTSDRAAVLQGRSPDQADPTPYLSAVSVDLAGPRAALEYQEPRADGTERWRRFEYHDGVRVVVDHAARATSRGAFPSAARMRAELARRVPHLLLAEALRNDARLGVAADTTVAGRGTRVVTYAPPDQRVPLRLYIDREEARLVGVAYTMEYAGFADVPVALWFDAYREVAGVGPFPTGHRLLVDGRALEVVRYTLVTADPAAVAAGFVIPEEIAARAATGGAVTQPAPGVFVVHGLNGLTAMFVEFRDFVVAVEAPAQAYLEFAAVPAGGLPPGDTVAEGIIRRIREAIPGKPIRYVTASHHHNDHAGGVRAFWAEGATLLTTPGTRGYFERLASRASTVVPDRLSRAGPAPRARIEVVADRRVISDGDRTLEVLSFGRSLHTDESLVVYLPRERILYQGDAFYFDGEASFPPRARVRVMREFAEWVRARGLSVERVYGTHLAGYATARHLEAMLTP